MNVHLTRIYTKTGDDGTTALGDMSRVAKTSARIGAYADVDEANSAIGVAIALGELAADIVALLTRIQNDLFDVGADLCTPVVPDPKYPPLRITDADVERLEAACDEYNARAACTFVVHPARRHPRRRAAASGAHDRPPGRAAHLGTAGSRARDAPTAPRRST